MSSLAEQPRSSPPAILLVEDERIVAGDIEDSLRRMGYDVSGSVSSSEECLQHAADRTPDLVLMDVRIRGGLDGVETAKLLRARHGVPIIYLTAYADEETLRRARETEAHGYLLKPFRSAELRSAVEMALFKHRAERDLRERERRLSVTLRAIADGVVTVDQSGVITFMNASAEQLLGCSEAQAEGKPLDDVFRVIDERTRRPLSAPLDDALKERRATRLPLNAALESSTQERPIDDSLAPIIDERGDLLGAVMVFRDVGEKRRAQAQIALADRLTSLGVLAAGVAHEINNPLTYVLGNAILARQELEELQQDLANQLPPGSACELPARIGQVQDELKEIELGAERIRQIVADLRVFARPDAGVESGDVVAALEWALRVTEGPILRRARLVKTLAPVPRVRGGDGRLGQVFVNLLLNAAEALEASASTDNVISVSTGLDERGRVLVSVQDTGPGMRPEVLRRIFEPFFTTKPIGAGTGLGLSICHGIVEAMGGKLEARSTVGVGTTFCIHLPTLEGTALESAPPPPSFPTQPRRGRVLVVDDDPRVLAAIVKMLTAHDVVIEQDGGRALSLLRADRAFDVVLCDLMMPGVSGIEFYEELCKLAPDLAPRVAFTTGGAFSERANQFLNDVPNPRLQKPFSQNQLEALLQSLLYTSRSK